MPSCSDRPPELERRRRDPLQHGVEHVVGAPLLGERAVREHEPVPKRVLRERADVGAEDVVAAVHERERAGALDERNRAARAGPVLDEAGDVVEPDRARDARVASASETA